MAVTYVLFVYILFLVNTIKALYLYLFPQGAPNSPTAERARMCPSPNNLSPISAGGRHRHHHRHHHQHQRRRSKSPQPESTGSSSSSGAERRGHKGEDPSTGHAHHHRQHHHHGGGGDREDTGSNGNKKWTAHKPTKEEDDIFKTFHGALQNRE